MKILIVLILLFPAVSNALNVRNCDNSKRVEFVAPNPKDKSKYICIKKLVCEVQRVDVVKKKTVSSKILVQNLEANCPAISADQCPTDSKCLEKSGHRVMGRSKMISKEAEESSSGKKGQTK